MDILNFFYKSFFSNNFLTKSNSNDQLVMNVNDKNTFLIYTKKK